MTEQTIGVDELTEVAAEEPKTIVQLQAELEAARAAYDASAAGVRDFEHRIASHVAMRIGSRHFDPVDELKPLVDEYQAAVEHRRDLLTAMSDASGALLAALGEELEAQRVRREALREERAERSWLRRLIEG